MNFLLVLLVTTALVVALRHPIKQYPGVFYAICILLNVLFVVNSFVDLPSAIKSFLQLLMHKGGLGVSLFVIVMWIGVFSRTGTVSKWMRPIRAELSIMASILILSHMGVYLMAYLPRALSGAGFKDSVAVSFAIALCMLVLVLVLGLTSFRFMKRHINAKNWKRLQNFAYIFYVLILIHVLLMLMPAALVGRSLAIEKVVIYLVVFGGYLVARIWRAIVDKRNKIDLVDTIRDQGFVK